MQTVAQSWLVLVLTGSPLTLGVVTALQFLPILILSVLGGVVADRLPRRRLLLATQTSAMLLAFALAIMTETGAVRVGHVMVLAALLGLVNAVDMPTRQAFVVELVAREDLHNAIALNSVAFNSARLIGPALAGLAIGWIGLAGAFFLNGLSFLGVIGVLLTMRTGWQPATRGVDPGSLWDDLKEGLGYVARTPVVRMVVLLVGIVATFGMNLGVLIPVLARDTLRVGAEGYGFLTSSMGLGSLAAALLLAYLGQPPRRQMVLGAAASMGLLQLLLGGVEQYSAAILLLGGIGFSMILFTTLSNTALQTSTPDDLRGRVMSVYATVFVGSTPFGSLFVGAIAEHRGVGAALELCGLITVVAALIGFRLSRGLQRPR